MKKEFAKFDISKKFMHKNAIKIVWGVKNCALFTKNMALFGEKNCAPFCALFVQKMCAFELKTIGNSAAAKGEQNLFPVSTWQSAISKP